MERLAGALCLLLLSCSEADEQSHARRDRSGNSERSFRVSCSPSVLGPGDILRVVVDGSHGGSVAIIDPNGKRHLIAVENWPADEGTVPPLSAVYVANTDHFELPVSQVSRAVIDDDPAPIFKRSGAYRLIVGHQRGAFLDELIATSECRFLFNSELSTAGKNLRRAEPPGWLWVLNSPKAFR